MCLYTFYCRYTNYIDILTKEEEEEITREKNLKDDAFSRLAKREYELAQIRDGDITSAKKPKSTNFTKSVAFKNYMKMYYDKPKPTVSLALSMLAGTFVVIWYPLQTVWTQIRTDKMSVLI